MWSKDWHTQMRPTPESRGDTWQRDWGLQGQWLHWCSWGTGTPAERGAVEPAPVNLPPLPHLRHRVERQWTVGTWWGPLSPQPVHWSATSIAMTTDWLITSTFALKYIHTTRPWQRPHSLYWLYAVGYNSIALPEWSSRVMLWDLLRLSPPAKEVGLTDPEGGRGRDGTI